MTVLDRRRAKLVLADGSRFDGWLTGTGELPVWGEVVFNTSMTGYQEVITDPSYAGQIVVMTYPEIGNYGVQDGDNERQRCAARGLVVRRLSTFCSPRHGRQSLESFMCARRLPGLTGVDTRAVTLRIRKEGAVVGVIGLADASDGALVDLAQEKAKRREVDLVASVTTSEMYVRPGEGTRAAVVDFGAKNSIVNSVVSLGVETAVLPASFSAADILDGNYDFVVLSNGPGDPTDVPEAIHATRQLIGHIPILGVCLGHQITALALGGHTYKLKFGHRGANQPVVASRTGRVFMTSQNHGYAVSDDLADVPGVEITYSNASDGTVEGFSDPERMVECVQFHPEASPGPHDTSCVFSEFFSRVKRWKNAAA